MLLLVGAQPPGACWLARPGCRKSGSRENLAGLGEAESKGHVRSVGQFADLREKAGSHIPTSPKAQSNPKMGTVLGFRTLERRMLSCPPFGAALGMTMTWGGKALPVKE